MLEIRFKTNLIRFLKILIRVSKYWRSLGRDIDIDFPGISLFSAYYSITISLNTISIHLHRENLTNEIIASILNIVNIVISDNYVKACIETENTYVSNNKFIELINNNEYISHDELEIDEIRNSNIFLNTIRYLVNNRKYFFETYIVTLYKKIVKKLKNLIEKIKIRIERWSEE